MDRDQLLKQLMAVFLGELEEHVRTMNRDLLRLEKAPALPERSEILQELFRTAHSLKGAARAVSIKPIETACHSAEEILAGAREGSRQIDRETFQYLFAAADALQDAGRRLREGQSLGGAPIEAFLAGQLPAPSVPPAPASMPPAPASMPPAPASMPPAPASMPAASMSGPSVPPASMSGPPASTAAAERGELFSAHARSLVPPERHHASVRVAASKLDALLTQNGGLLHAETRLSDRFAEATALHELIARCRSEWQSLERPMRKLIAGERPAGRLPGRLTAAFGRTREALSVMEKDLEKLLEAMARDRRSFAQTAGAIDSGVRSIRMLPFAEACQGLARVVRDLAGEQGKDVEFVLTGGDIEIDRALLEGLKDPLMHLVRNAVDHGIESSAERVAAGKPARGYIEISAALRGAQIELCIDDDGRGLDKPAIRERASSLGLSDPQDDADLMRLIFQPGFSTSPALTAVSGRGIGLDVVKSRVEALHGHIQVGSAKGAGTRFQLTMPLTVTTIRAVLVGAAGQIFAFVTTHIERLLCVRPDDLRSIQGRPVLAAGGPPLSAASLGEILGLPGREPPQGGASVQALIVQGHGRSVAVVVDELLGTQEILVKSLGPRLKRVRHLSGATILPNGRIALIVHAGELVETVVRQSSSRALPAGPAAAPRPRRRILVADDSATMRSLSKSILEGAGFEVVAARDGAEAFRLLQEKGADLVVSDIEMPGMDGLALTEAIRSSKRFERLPVILLTALGGENDKTRGLAVGADAYLVKSAFDQAELIETIEQLL
jgi:two-component system chemotaxis sensor kinase CheA